MSETKSVRFWFDFISPNAYIAWLRLGPLAERYGARVLPVPVLYAGLLDHHGRRGPAEVPAKRAWMIGNVLRKATELGIPFGPPPAHPFNPLLALRCCTVEMRPEERSRLIDALFHAAWGGGGGVTDPAVVARTVEGAGFDGEALLRQAETGEVKQRLRRATESAVAAGVFGVPTMTVAGELFWGYDDFHWLERLLAGEDRLDTDNRRLWSDLRPSAVRPGSRRGGSRPGEQDSS